MLEYGSVNHGWEIESNSLLHDEWRFDCASLKQIRMIANLSQLHEDIHDAEEIAVIQCLLRFITVDVLIIEEPLAP